MTDRDIQMFIEPSQDLCLLFFLEYSLELFFGSELNVAMSDSLKDWTEEWDYAWDLVFLESLASDASFRKLSMVLRFLEDKGQTNSSRQVKLGDASRFLKPDKFSDSKSYASLTLLYKIQNFHHGLRMLFNGWIIFKRLCNISYTENWSKTKMQPHCTFLFLCNWSLHDIHLHP